MSIWTLIKNGALGVLPVVKPITGIGPHYCPRCKVHFSDWFTWNGDRYCYLCWEATGEVIKEARER